VLAELAERPDVVALTFPVDYWDYLGWKDTLAQPAFSARQRAYAGARGDRQVFTPQMVVNGAKPCIGSDRAKLESLMNGREPGAAGGEAPALQVPVDVREASGRVTVEVGTSPPGSASPPGSGAAEVWLVPVTRSATVRIGRGENRGRTATYANVVRGMARLGVWRGGPARFEAPSHEARAGGADAYVVLVQSAGPEGRPGPILGAARGP
jgi:hypothetical protein